MTLFDVFSSLEIQGLIENAKSESDVEWYLQRIRKWMEDSSLANFNEQIFVLKQIALRRKKELVDI